jgi:hypothetical protein
MTAIDEMLRTLGSVGGVVMVVGVVGLFATMAVLLWSWRRSALRESGHR